ncbi:MAG: hypothetical protein JSS20_15205, partial [Proteobacteria bacterium]|nr:hypothetical protein [Pseudomonadota bacterium]
MGAGHGVRFSTRNGPLADLIRQRQDTIGRLHNAAAVLDRALASPSGRQSDQDLAAIRRDVATLNDTLKSLTAKIEQAFPAFADLSSPKPISIGEVQKLLATDEVLIAHIISTDASFVWAISRDHSRWQRIDLDGNTIVEKITALRAGLDAEDLNVAAAAGKLFDLSLAHDIYEILIG